MGELNFDGVITTQEENITVVLVEKGAVVLNESAPVRG